MSRHRSSSSSILTSPLLIILLPILAFLFLFLVLPPFLSIASHILRPNSVKKSWDSFSIFLVLFAILCGILAKKNDDDSVSEESNISNTSNEVANNTSGIEESPEQPSNQWFGFSQENNNKIYDSAFSSVPETNKLRLRRNSRSYPDLRQESIWENREEEQQKFQFRFFDDFEINKYRTVPVFEHQSKVEQSSPDNDIKEIPVDTFEIQSSSTPPKSLSTPPPPPPTPPSTTHHKQNRTQKNQTHQTLGRKEKIQRKWASNGYGDSVQFRSPPPTPPPPPPRRPAPPPSPIRIRYEQNHVKLERKKSSAKKEIAMVLTSLYKQRKRKKQQKTNTYNNYDTATSISTSTSTHMNIRSCTETTPSYRTVPPPPPPPPSFSSSSMFHGLFKKGSKSKKIHSVPPPPPPPPPISSPARPTKYKSSCSVTVTPPAPAPHSPEPYRRQNYKISGKPPLPRKTSASSYDENVNVGSQSPLIPMPPPPPPPPFKMPEMKFSFRGDFVKIQSTQSSRCGSPDLEDDVDQSSSSKVDSMDGGDGVFGSVCPSPDVNVKADKFISRLRDEWKFEKMSSMKEKNKRASA